MSEIATKFDILRKGIATKTKLGQVIIGDNVNVQSSGKISVTTSSTVVEGSQAPINSDALISYVSPIVEVKTTAEWNANPSYIPAKGTICVYSDGSVLEDSTLVPKIKVADGLAYIVDQPFTDADIQEILDRKISVTIDGEILIFYI